MNAVRKIAIAALNKHGGNAQLGVVQEECAELITAISHCKRKRTGADAEVIAEAGDVAFMLEQVRVIYGDAAIDDAMQRSALKLARNMEKEVCNELRLR